MFFGMGASVSVELERPLGRDARRARAPRARGLLVHEDGEVVGAADARRRRRLAGDARRPAPRRPVGARTGSPSGSRSTASRRAPRSTPSRSPRSSCAARSTEAMATRRSLARSRGRDASRPSARAIVPESRAQIDVLLHVLRQRDAAGRARRRPRRGDAVLLDAVLTRVSRTRRGVALDYSSAMRELAGKRLGAAARRRAQVRPSTCATPAWLRDAARPTSSCLGLRDPPPRLTRASARSTRDLRRARRRAGRSSTSSTWRARRPRSRRCTTRRWSLSGRGADARERGVELRCGRAAVPRAARQGRQHPGAGRASSAAWLREIGFVDVDVLLEVVRAGALRRTKPCS